MVISGTQTNRCSLHIPYNTGVFEKTLLLCEPVPCNPVAETALQPLIQHSESLSPQASSSPEECFFSDTGIIHSVTSSLSGGMYTCRILSTMLVIVACAYTLVSLSATIYIKFKTCSLHTKCYFHKVHAKCAVTSYTVLCYIMLYYTL